MLNFIIILSLNLILSLRGGNSLALDYLLPYNRPQNQDVKLSAFDETSSPEIYLETPIYFYDSKYTSLFVNSNGIISFLTEIPSYVNQEFPIGYPIIAPYYSDIDLTQGGAIYYGKHVDKSAVNKINDLLVQNVAIDADNFTTKHIFAATWENVKGYLQDLPQNNTFQAIIASDDERTYVIFLYPRNALNWYTTRARTANLPPVRVQVGFDAGDGFRTFNLPKTKNYKVLSLSKRSNVGIPGVWIYHVGFVRNVEEPFPMHSPPHDGGKSVGDEFQNVCDEYSCPNNAKCLNYSVGFCCACNSGFYGNGINCLIQNSPQRINGRLNGIINGQALTGVELQAYIVTVDGRIYTALSQIPGTISHGMKLLLPLTESINWLFANNAPNVSNGFILTGGVFNRSVSINFGATGEQLDIREYFEGIDNFGNLVMNAEIQGDLPLVQSHSQMEFFDYMQEYKNVETGKIMSESKLVFKIDGKEYSFGVSQEIRFEECHHSERHKKESASILAVTRNFAVYDEREKVLRFASQSKIKSIEHNPCKDIQCPPYSTCTFLENSYRCLCNNGYSKSGELCKDIDECKVKLDRCHPDSVCVNNPGSYSCKCKLGLMQDGITCLPSKQPSLKETEEETIDCSHLKGFCNTNGQCYLDKSLNSYRCRCNIGFLGDGIDCEPINTDILAGSVTSCIPNSRNFSCDANAHCILGTAGQGYQCECKKGYQGNGTQCYPLSTSDCRENPQMCDSKAGLCEWNEKLSAYHCSCKKGFVGDGKFCKELSDDESQGSSDITSKTKTPISRVKSESLDQEDCPKVPHPCNANGECFWDAGQSQHSCRCLSGYSGDGITCTLLDESSEGEDCSISNFCHHKAQCTYDTRTNGYECQCNPGYYGDGISSCLFDKSCKYDASICGSPEAGSCIYDPIKHGHSCSCHPGYTPSGQTCVKSIESSCSDNPSICHREAKCVQFGDRPADFKCQCNYGFIGDGSRHCQAVNPLTMGLIYAQGSSIMRIPVSIFPPPPPLNLQSVRGGSRKRQNIAEAEHLGHYLSSDQSQIAVGVGSDCLTGELFWTDVSGRKIKKSNHDGTRIETFLERGIKTPELLAIDWASRNIFWTDSEKRSLEMASLDGEHRRIVVDQNLINPRGIAIDWREGRVYWSDWSRDLPKIESCMMDGSDRKILVSRDIKLPNSLIFDDYSRDLCWVDAGTKRLECMNVHNNARRILVSNLTYPFGLTQTDSNFYWTDWKRSEIMSAEKQRGLMNPPLNPALGGNGRLYGITSIMTTCPRTSNACTYNKGGCKYICVPLLSNHRNCLCPDDLKDCSVEEKVIHS